MTHEEYIHKVREIAVHRLPERDRAPILGAKLVYGLGVGYRGVCVYSAWQSGEDHHAVIEVSATNQESHLQIAGTTIHECGHALAGHGAAHGKDWKAACARLGLEAQAMGQTYEPEHFASDIRDLILRLPLPDEGLPAILSAAGRVIPGAVAGPVRKTRPGCSAGIGARGGTSRGPGSGSRLRLWVCNCAPAVKVRIASDDFRATCGRCNGPFKRFEKPV